MGEGASSAFVTKTRPVRVFSFVAHATNGTTSSSPQIHPSSKPLPSRARLFLRLKEIDMSENATRNDAKLLRISQIVGDPHSVPPVEAIVPIGRSSWWAKVKSGEAPAPVKIGKRVTAWRASDIEKFVASLETSHRGD